MYIFCLRLSGKAHMSFLYSSGFVGGDLFLENLLFEWQYKVHAWICAWFILGEGRFLTYRWCSGLELGLEGGWVESGFVRTSSDGAFWHIDVHLGPICKFLEFVIHGCIVSVSLVIIAKLSTQVHGGRTPYDCPSHVQSKFATPIKYAIDNFKSLFLFYHMHNHRYHLLYICWKFYSSSFM